MLYEVITNNISKGFVQIAVVNLSEDRNDQQKSYTTIRPQFIEFLILICWRKNKTRSTLFDAKNPHQRSYNFV